MNQELIRIVDNISRDKNIDKESIFVDLEEAMVSAVRKHFGEPESTIVVHIDRATGQVTAYALDALYSPSTPPYGEGLPSHPNPFLQTMKRLHGLLTDRQYALFHMGMLT